MTPQSRWVGGLFLAGILGIGGVVLMPYLHRPSASPKRRPWLAAPPSAWPSPPVSATPAGIGGRAVTAAPQPAPSPPPESPLNRRRQDWGKRFPGDVLPYAYTNGGPKPGPPKQQLSGFTLEAQASDAPDPLGQTPPPSTSQPPRVCTQLTAETNQPRQGPTSWELNQNGLSAEGSPEARAGVASVGFRPEGEGSQAAGIIQYLEMRPGHRLKRVIIHGLLRQSEDYEETLVFRTPKIGAAGGAGQADWQTQETPSGVKVTLPPQALSTVGGPGLDGILRLNFGVNPSQTPVALPQSPLYKKYQQPVLLRVGAMTPSGGAYDYPFSDPQGVMSLYKQANQPWQYGPSPDVLTLIVQQRVYVREIPFALAVPVSHHPFDVRPRTHTHL